MRRALLSLALLTAGLAPGPHPLLFPARDVTIDYTLEPAGQPARDITVAVEAGGTRLRVTSPDLPTTFLIDRPAGTATILLPLLRLYSEVRVGELDPERTILRGAAFTPEGPARLAGLRCRRWHATSPQGNADGCLTPDGVLLAGSAVSNRRGALGTIEARRVVYGPLDPGEFAIPPDFQEAPVKLSPNGMPE